MKHKSKLIATVGIVTGLAIGGYALTSYASGYHERCGGYDGGRHGMMGGGHKSAERMMHMMERYDSDSDGALTLDEIKTERGKQFKAFDKNADGSLDLGEYQALWADAMRERMVDRFQKHDNDGDGKISEEDFSGRFLRMMTWMDRNEDGKIDREDHPRGYRHHDKD